MSLKEALVYIRSKDFIYRAIAVFVVLFAGYGGILYGIDHDTVFLVTLWMMSASQWIIDLWFKHQAKTTVDSTTDLELVVDDIKTLVQKESE